jgi:hypothetical protein
MEILQAHLLPLNTSGILCADAGPDNSGPTRDTAALPYLSARVAARF